jgi:hypothetical protein
MGGLALAWKWTQQARRAQHGACDGCAGCPELVHSGICSGFREQAEHLRAYEEEATILLERDFVGKHLHTADGPGSLQNSRDRV